MPNSKMDTKFLLTAVAGLVGTIGYLAYSYFTKEDEEEEFRSDLRRLPIGEVTLEELKVYNGTDNPRVLTSICGRIFDLSSAPDFYGPSGGYNCFAGGDSTYMLATVSLKPENLNKTEFTLTDEQSETLVNWIGSTYLSKYPIVGILKGNFFFFKSYFIQQLNLI